MWVFSGVFRRAGRCGQPGEDVAEPVEPGAPEFLELLEVLTRTADGRDVGADEVLAALASLDHQARSLEHRDVLLDGGERHRVVPRERGHRVLGERHAAQDVEPGGVAQRREHAVGVLPVRLTYNHEVVR